MVLEFPGDPGSATLDMQYMFGPSLLVAPVFTGDGSVEVYLPPGRWTHLLSGEVKHGGWHAENHGYLSAPLYVRGNTLLAIGAHDDETAYDYAEGVTLELYSLGDGNTARCAVPTRDGSATALEVSVTRDGPEISVSARGAGPWQLLLVGETVTGPGVEVTQTVRGALVAGRDGLRLKLGAAT
jgi:alpha-D-xyloside xylohydrolase